MWQHFNTKGILQNERNDLNAEILPFTNVNKELQELHFKIVDLKEKKEQFTNKHNKEALSKLIDSFVEKENKIRESIAQINYKIRQFNQQILKNLSKNDFILDFQPFVSRRIQDLTTNTKITDKYSFESVIIKLLLPNDDGSFYTHKYPGIKLKVHGREIITFKLDVSPNQSLLEMIKTNDTLKFQKLSLHGIVTNKPIERIEIQRPLTNYMRPLTNHTIVKLP